MKIIRKSKILASFLSLAIVFPTLMPTSFASGKQGSMTDLNPDIADEVRKFIDPFMLRVIIPDPTTTRMWYNEDSHLDAIANGIRTYAEADEEYIPCNDLERRFLTRLIKDAIFCKDPENPPMFILYKRFLENKKVARYISKMGIQIEYDINPCDSYAIANAKFIKYFIKEQWDNPRAINDELDREGKTMLHIFASGGAPARIVQIAIDAGADVDATDDMGRTPLYYAGQMVRRIKWLPDGSLGSYLDSNREFWDCSVVNVLGQALKDKYSKIRKEILSKK